MLMIKWLEYLIDRASGNIMLFSKTHENAILVKAYKMKARYGLFVENGNIYIFDNFKKTKLIDLNSIPITFNGRLECNIENVLAASSVLYGLGESHSAIRKGLNTFKSD